MDTHLSAVGLAAAVPRHLTEVTAYQDDDGWLVHEFPSGRVERLARPGGFEVASYPVGRPLAGPRPSSKKAEDLDWSDYPGVEIIPGKVSGQPLIVDTRLPVDALLLHAEGGVDPEEIADLFEVTPDLVREVLEVATKKGWRVAGPA